MDEPTKRKLAAILMADVAGYSRLMGEDETATVRTLKACREIFASRIGQHDGRVVNTPGDSILAEFSSVVNAVAAAIDIQRELAERNRDLPSSRTMQFRIGINLGDVLSEANAIYGDGVNIAARLESLADPGGVCISRTAYDQVEGKLTVQWEYTGEHAAKNIAKPIRTYRLVPKDDVRPAVCATPDIDAAHVLSADEKTRASEGLAGHSSIAVLPFENMSGDPEQEYFVDGITEEIITELARYRSLDVMARNSTFQYKNKAVDVRQVGKDLGVRYVIEGSVRKAAQRIRVAAQLLDAASGAHLWAETYERQLTAEDIFSIQDDISERVAGTIASEWGIIQRSRIEQATRHRTDKMDAYDAVLRARRYRHDNRSQEAHLDARDLLEHAIEISPDYAEAWATLGLLYRDEYGFGYNARSDPLPRALKATRRALELDPMNPLAHFGLSSVYFFQKDEAFFQQVDRTIALNPNDPTLLTLGLFIAWCGQWERGLAMLRKSMALNPRHPSWLRISFIWDSYRRGEYEQALAEARKVDIPGLFWTHVAYSMCYGQLGRMEQAHRSVEKLLGLYPEFAKHAWEVLRKWFWQEELVAHMVDGLRKAGLEIPQDEELPSPDSGAPPAR